MQRPAPLATSPMAGRRLKFLYHHRTQSRDGQSVHIDELINALKTLGHEVIVVEPKRVQATKNSLKKAIFPKILYELLELAYSIIEYRRLVAAVIRYKPDAFYQRANVFMLSGVWLARRFKLPYLLEVNAPLAAERSKYGGTALPGLAAWTERRMWRAADKVLPVTAVLAKIVGAAGVPLDRISVIPNGVDLSRFTLADEAAAKRRLGLESRLVLGFVGFIREWHRLERVIGLLAEDSALATAHLLIVGDGPVRAFLEETARRLGIGDRVTITGIVSRAEVAGYIAAFDIALQPEVVHYASPLKLFEYMALGRAIIAPDTPNVCEVVEDGVDCLLFDVDKPDALSLAIRRLAEDKTLRDRLGKAALNTIVERQMTWSGNAQKVASLAEEVMAK
jgi:glycosyltransferase involved in cell wall biosynthesis